jgi:hypothetical protein
MGDHGRSRDQEADGHGTRFRPESEDETRSVLKGTVDGDTLEPHGPCWPIPAAELARPTPGRWADENLMDATPDYQAEVGDATTFWYAFGPV